MIQVVHGYIRPDWNIVLRSKSCTNIQAPVYVIQSKHQSNRRSSFLHLAPLNLHA